MKKSRHTSEQIVRMLREAEAKLAAGSSIAETARELGISEATFHRWRNRYGAMSSQERPSASKIWRRKTLVSRNCLPRRNWT